MDRLIRGSDFAGEKSEVHIDRGLKVHPFSSMQAAMQALQATHLL
jgi:hypothetical protein